MSPFLLEFTATSEYATLAELYDIAKGNEEGTTKYLGFAGTVYAHRDNGIEAIYLKSAAGDETTLLYDEWFLLQGCNIAGMSIKGDGLKIKFLGSSSSGW